MVYGNNRKLLGQLLLEKNVITSQQLDIALVRQKEVGEMLGTVLHQLGFIEQEPAILPFVAMQQGVKYVNLRQLEIPWDVIDKIPLRFARSNSVIPIKLDGQVMTVAMNKPYDISLKDTIQLMTNCEVEAVLASKKDILDAITKNYGIGAETIKEILESSDLTRHSETEVADLEDMNFDHEATIGNFFNEVILEAYRTRASDIHIEPYENKLMVRYRIDGVMQNVNVPKEIHYFKDALMSRIKIMSHLDISEKRLPQDGRFRTRVGDIDLDLRISFMPTPFGESAVIRILNTTRLYSFEELGLTEEERRILTSMIAKPNGIVFMTGPTGSGKTSTLYSCISKINTEDKKIITLEDPIEYQLQNVTQIQVNSGIKLTFAKGLRSVLRHDPDVILVGEVRDVETAEIAIQVALTGHLIFSTLHTNDAASGVTRLLNMGIEPYLITSTVECFIAQRLVRMVCPHCKHPTQISPEIIQEFQVDCEIDKDTLVFKGDGCEECNFTGYKGRTVILEILVLNDEINPLVLNRASSNTIKAKAMECGMKTLRQSGWEKVKTGLTSAEEVVRVTQERSKRK